MSDPEKPIPAWYSDPAAVPVLDVSELIRILELSGAYQLEAAFMQTEEGWRMIEVSFVPPRRPLDLT